MSSSAEINIEEIFATFGESVTDCLWYYDLARDEFSYSSFPYREMRLLGQESDSSSDPVNRLMESTRDYARSLAGYYRRDEVFTDDGMTEQKALTQDEKGPVLELEIRYRPVFDHPGRPGALAGVARDVSSQRKVHNALLRSETLYRTLLKTSPDAILILDAEGDVINANNQAERLTRQIRSDMIGHNYLEYIQPSQKEEARAMIRAILEYGRISEKEFEFCRQDGSVFTGEVSVSALHDSFRQSRIFMVVIRDVTRRKKAEREIVLSMERYQRLLETMNEGLIILDKNLLFTFINPGASEIFGYTFEELLGKPFFTLLDRESRKTARSGLDNLKTGGKTKARFELRVKSKKGDILHTLISANVITGHKGDHLGVFAIITDVTRERQADEERMRMEMELMDTLLSRLSDRELELLRFLVKGFRWPEQKREIGKLMDVLPGTLDKFMARIKSKMEIDDIREIISHI